VSCSGEGDGNVQDDAGVPKLTSKEESLLRLADATRAGGDVDAAEQLYMQVVAVSKGAVRGHLALADIYLARVQAPRAVEILKAAHQLQPKSLEVLRELGNAQITAGQIEKALKTYEMAIDVAGDDARFYSAKGVALDMLGRNKEAQAVYKDALKLAPDEGYIQNNMALSLILSGQYDEAIASLQKLMNTSDAGPVIRQNLAMAYGLKGDSDMAMKLSLEDLSPAEAKENVRFFEAYRRNQTASKKEGPAAADKAVPVPKVQSTPLEKVTPPNKPK
jgi:Flp pilus assembly protein TadD